MTPAALAPVRSPQPSAPPAFAPRAGTTTLTLTCGEVVAVAGDVDGVADALNATPDQLVRFTKASFGDPVWVRGSQVAAVRPGGPGAY